MLSTVNNMSKRGDTDADGTERVSVFSLVLQFHLQYKNGIEWMNWIGSNEE